MTVSTQSAVIDLAALVAHINQVVCTANVLIKMAMMAQSVQRLHSHGHTDVELVVVLTATNAIHDEQSAAPIVFEGSAFALRQGEILVGLCGARDIQSLTATAHKQVKMAMAPRTLPLSTRVVFGEGAMDLTPPLSRFGQAAINAVVDSLCLSQALALPPCGRPTARM